jgi:multidrug transporter EmrE-like cation transporter
MTNALLLGAYAVLSVASLLLLKLGAPAAREAGLDLARIPAAALAQLAAGVALYAASFAVWLAVLARLELSVAYPVAIGLTLAGISLASVVVLRESIGLLHLAGIALIFGGIVLVTRPA